MSSSLRFSLYALPAATVAVVALALVTAGSTRPARVARLWGGPTDAPRLSLRAEVFDVAEERGALEEAPVTTGQVTLRIQAPGFEAARSEPLDPEGGAEFALDVPTSARPIVVSVLQAGRELARGSVALAVGPWAQAARRRGGWAETRAGAFVVRVAPARGALAVPFEEPLLLAVSREGEPARGVIVHATAAGARLLPADAHLDERGRAVLSLAPREHAVTVAFELGAADAAVRASFALPVVPGAMRARLDAGDLVIESPVPRDVAYFALVTPTERLLGGRVVLHDDERGSSQARVPLGPLARAAEYAVVSSERDLRSPAAVGWPLVPEANGEPARTFDAVDALLLDGRPRALRREAERRSRVRWVVGAFCAAALAIELALLLAFTRSSDRGLDAHLAGAGVSRAEAARLAPKRSTAVAVALIVIALGFLVVASIGVLKLE